MNFKESTGWHNIQGVQMVGLKVLRMKMVSRTPSGNPGANRCWMAKMGTALEMWNDGAVKIAMRSKVLMKVKSVVKVSAQRTRSNYNGVLEPSNCLFLVATLGLVVLEPDGHGNDG